MSMIRIPKSQFKPKAFEILRMVEEQNETVIVTDRGRDAVTITRANREKKSMTDSLAGGVEWYTDPTKPVGEEEWEALQ